MQMVRARTTALRVSPTTSSFVLSFGTKARTIGIFMDGHTSESKTVNKNNEVDDQSSEGSSQRAFLSALVKNNLGEVRTQLSSGMDPNFAVHIGLMGGTGLDGDPPSVSESGVTADDEGIGQQNLQLSMKALCLDHVFLFKRILGDSPSPLHLAILNVYFRTKHFSSRYLLRQNRDEFDKAMAIFRLLLEFGANIRHTSFQAMASMHGETPGTSLNTPLDLAERIHRLACLVDANKATSLAKGSKVIDLQTAMRSVVVQCIGRETLDGHVEDQARGDVNVQDEESIRQDDKSRSAAASVGESCDDEELDRPGQLDELADLIFSKGQSSSTPTTAYSMKNYSHALTLFCSDSTT